MSDASLTTDGSPGRNLTYPINAPEKGETVEVAKGIHWLRMPLPFRLDHINLWILEDGDGWTIIDTGVKMGEAKKVWEKVAKDLLGDKPVKRLIVTHLHPDHVGLAGWMEHRFGAPLWMSRTDYIQCRMLWHDTGRDAPEAGIRFYRAAGFPEDAIETYKKRFGGFGEGVERMPDSYHRLEDGQVITIGDDEWRIIMGSGHAPEHACLYSPARDIFISGDQVIPRISSNVSVHPTEPDADPLKAWIDSCHKIKAEVPDTVLVCPAHQKAFRGLHARLDQLIDGHERGLSNLLKALDEPRRAVDVFGALYKRKIGPELLGMATGESLAHLNCLIGRGLARRTRDADGIDWYQAV